MRVINDPGNQLCCKSKCQEEKKKKKSMKRELIWDENIHTFVGSGNWVDQKEQKMLDEGGSGLGKRHVGRSGHEMWRSLTACYHLPESIHQGRGTKQPSGQNNLTSWLSASICHWPCQHWQSGHMNRVTLVAELEAVHDPSSMGSCKALC